MNKFEKFIRDWGVRIQVKDDMKWFDNYMNKQSDKYDIGLPKPSANIFTQAKTKIVKDRKEDNNDK